MQQATTQNLYIDQNIKYVEACYTVYNYKAYTMLKTIFSGGENVENCHMFIYQNRLFGLTIIFFTNTISEQYAQTRQLISCSVT